MHKYKKSDVQKTEVRSVSEHYKAAKAINTNADILANLLERVELLEESLAAQNSKPVKKEK